eukprot:363885-Chlamydomonas_euryale.AAC.27
MVGPPGAAPAHGQTSVARACKSARHGASAHSRRRCGGRRGRCAPHGVLCLGRPTGAGSGGCCGTSIGSGRATPTPCAVPCAALTGRARLPRRCVPSRRRGLRVGNGDPAREVAEWRRSNERAGALSVRVTRSCANLRGVGASRHPAPQADASEERRQRHGRSAIAICEARRGGQASNKSGWRPRRGPSHAYPLAFSGQPQQPFTQP